MEESFKISKKTKKIRNDTAVQGTNDSAVLSKISMAQLGYFNDDYLKYFGIKAVRRSPIINRGYYIRAKTVDFVLQNFLKHNFQVKKQILNLGAGFDSTFFRLKTQSNALDNTLFVDIDFPDVISRKINLIEEYESLKNVCPDLCMIYTVNGNLIYRSISSNYALIGIDMRDTQYLEAMLKLISEFDEIAPTLLLSEVVMTYMAVNSCNNVIKWIPETFQNCMIAVYEQIQPDDAFGQVMCAHFKKLGSPLKCIYRYPTKESQIRRYKELGFIGCKATRIIDFFKSHITSEENDRVNGIELFDEYEQWHLKCSHYNLVLASKGTMLHLMENLIDDKNDFDRIFDGLQLNEIKDRNLIIISEFPLKFGVRFGHSVCSNSSGDKIYIIGGFGESMSEVGRHKRLNTIEIVDLKNMKIELPKVLDSSAADRLFSSSCVLNNSENIVLIFGRGSPNKPFKTNILKINFNETENLIEFSSVSYDNSDEIELTRWRHASCKLNNDKIVVFGGKKYNQANDKIETLGDCLIFSNNKWDKIPIDESLCKPRYSHSMCKWKNYVIISGGLDDNEDIYEDILLFDSETFKIKKLEIKNGFTLPRYSHTSHVINDKLLFIGGVNFNSKQPGLGIIDLNNLKSIELELPAHSYDDSPLMIHNHQTHMIDENNILLIGGGGNCFSFGTHINKKPILINIKNCWNLFDKEPQ